MAMRSFSFSVLHHMYLHIASRVCVTELCIACACPSPHVWAEAYMRITVNLLFFCSKSLSRLQVNHLKELVETWHVQYYSLISYCLMVAEHIRVIL